MINNAVFFKIPLIGTGGHQRHGAFKGEDGNGLRRVGGIGNADDPGAPVGLAADGLHIASQRQYGGIHTFFFQKFCAALGGIPLGDTAEIQPRARVQGHRRPVKMDVLCPDAA